ncbi:MAG: hypothetical protein HY042_07590, partial [Spirochaetia bacterium]|nr:hypothetical protein [Spirochaetia bacterium]
MSHFQALSGPESLAERHAGHVPGAADGKPVLHLEKKNDERTILAVSEREEDLACLLECFYTAHLVKERGSLSTAIIVHPKNAQLARHSQLFDDVYEFDSHVSLAKQLR